MADVCPTPADMASSDDVDAPVKEYAPRRGNPRQRISLRLDDDLIAGIGELADEQFAANRSLAAAELLRIGLRTHRRRTNAEYNRRRGGQ